LAKHAAWGCRRALLLALQPLVELWIEPLLLLEFWKQQQQQRRRQLALRIVGRVAQ
jgi:hypothetical protein